MAQEHTLGTYKLERIMRLNAVPENLFERIAARGDAFSPNTKLFRIDRGSDADPTFASSFQPWDRYVGG
jgi:hypothetical protein